MKKNNSKKKTFRPSKIHVVVLLLVVGILSLFAYQATSRDYIYATDSAGTFSYEYPENWTIEPYVWEDCCGPIDEEPDWSKESKPITLHPSNDKNVSVTIGMEKYGDYWGSFNALKTTVKEDYFAKILFEGTRPDGHEALFSRVDYLGPPDAKVESFNDHRYYFDNDKTVVRVEFREKYHHDWPDDETGPDIDNSEYLQDFEHIAQSIEFLN